MIASRQAVAAYVQTHLAASHRQIARALSVSPSTVDRACRQLRQMTHSDCSHGQPGAPLVTQADAPAVTQQPVPDAVTQRWRCQCCGAGWQRGSRCEQCGWPKGIPR